MIPTGSSASEMLKVLNKNDLICMMPQMSKALRILDVILAMSASAEQSFSSLRMLKTYLRTQ